MNSPLNAKLYRQLHAEFGKVSVSKPGMATLYATADSQTAIADGERYVVDCPYCGGIEKLWISYEWGVKDTDRGTDNWGRAICWRDDCLNKADNLETLRRDVFQPRRGERRGRTQRADLLAGTTAETWKAVAVDLPPHSEKLTDLGPRHPANLYLQERGYDPAQLEHL